MKNIRVLISIGSLLIACGIGYYMFDLAIQEKLWGHLPLLFFVALWVSILALWKNKVTPHPKANQLFWAAIGSGILLAIGFPPLPLVFTLFIGFVPLLWIEKQLADNGNRTRSVFHLTFIAFVTWNILTTFWVANASFPSGIVAIVANSLLMTLPFIGLNKVRKYFNEKLIYWAFIAYWLTFEYIHLNWDLSWPWLTLGNGLAYFPSLMQWYEYTGVMGGSAWILLLNVLFFQAFLQYQSTDFQWRNILKQPLLVLLLPVGFSLYVYFTLDTQTDESLEVIVVQPNYEPHYAKDREHQNMQLRKVLSLANKQVSRSTDYIVMPETTFEGINFSQRDQFLFLQLKKFLNGLPKTKIITGVGGYRVIEDGQETPNTRTYKRNDGSVLKYEAYNAAKQIRLDSIDYGLYTKSKLVPGAESLPYPSVLGLALKPIFGLFGGTTAGLGQSDSLVIFDI